MEIKISISALISIYDGKVNVNEILHESGKFGDLLKKKITEEIIEDYQETIVNKMCEDGDELRVEHIRKGTKDEICSHKEYIQHGYRKQKRKIKLDFGEIEFDVMNVKCKGLRKD